MTARTVLLFALAAVAALAVSASGAAMPNLVRIPNLRPHPGLPDAIFRHSDHGNFMCHGCHPSLFPTERVGFTHDDFAAGRFCGHCHDGQAAWAIAEAPCERCHVAP